MVGTTVQEGRVVLGQPALGVLLAALRFAALRVTGRVHVLLEEEQDVLGHREAEARIDHMLEARRAVDLGDVAVGYLVPDLELLLALRVDALQVPAGVALRRPFARGRGGTVVVVVPRGLRLVVRQTTPRVVSPRALGPVVGATTR